MNDHAQTIQSAVNDGMGLKTAACWIGNLWSVRTYEWTSGEEWTPNYAWRRGMVL